MQEASIDDLTGHGGDHVVEALTRFGVEEIFTLSGGHVFPIHDACFRRGVKIYDVRHEQSAGFGAEAMGKLMRRPGVCVVTAGPGLTNTISAIASASFNGSPMVIISGRAGQARWGQGSLQEIEHIPLVDSITKSATTIFSPEEIYKRVVEACKQTNTPPRGPSFLDVPIDVLFSSRTVGRGELSVENSVGSSTCEPDYKAVQIAGDLLANSRRPILIGGGDIWLGRAEDHFVSFAERFELPTFQNGQGRGILGFDHPLSVSRSRHMLKEADLVIVVGTPLDFRLGFGRFGGAKVVHLVDSPDKVAGHVEGAISLVGNLADSLEALSIRAQEVERKSTSQAQGRTAKKSWLDELAGIDRAAWEADIEVFNSPNTPIHPLRIFGDLDRVIDRDAIVIGDGGDFVSFAGKYVKSYKPGCWLDPGPYGCLGTSAGYLMAARAAFPDRQVIGLIGDGAFGFSGLDVDSLVRHKMAVVLIVGNNGIWGLEKHPMRAIYGYDVACDLQPGCRYDQVVQALGGAGETVEDPDHFAPALERALASGVPYLVNVITDPNVIYPRSSNLA